jgi:hypothetical protein
VSWSVGGESGGRWYSDMSATPDSFYAILLPTGGSEGHLVMFTKIKDTFHGLKTLAGGGYEQVERFPA